MKLNKKNLISIVIPVLNESDTITNLLSYLKKNTSPKNVKEIIVVDGGSIDDTIQLAKNFDVTIVHSKKGRALQMNSAAKVAAGDVLYFIHVDTVPPKNFDESILNAVREGGKAGCFRMKFDSRSKFLGFFAWCTKLNFKICRGGDQTLFIKKELFERIGGFNEKYVVYEDNEFTDRLYELVDFKILPRHVITSARRYEQRGEIKLQFHFGMMHLKNYMGAGPEKLYDYYSKKILV